MKSRLLLLIAATVTLASIGCGFHGGIRRDVDTRNDFQYKMDITEVQYTRTASGSSNIGSLFCFIPFGDDPYKNAMADLQKNAALKKNEVLANYRDDQGITGLIYLYCNFRLTVSADVLTLTPSGGSPAAAAP